MSSKLKVKVLRALQDNYMYLVYVEGSESKDAFVVDPVDPLRVFQEVKDLGLNLTSVLTTHHHWDHAGGNKEMSEKKPGIKVYGGDSRIPALTDAVKHGDEFCVGNMQIKCLCTPCHTSGHVCYFVRNLLESPDGTIAVFTGDTLFTAGCGKFFEGNPKQMYTALVEILSALPDNTLVYCGHEYTVNNLKYALHAEPDNECISKKLAWAKKKRASDEITIPSTIQEEKTYNPFMRVHQPSLQKHAGMTDPVEVMGFLRKEKDYFKA